MQVLLTVAIDSLVAALISDDPWSLHGWTALIAVVIIAQPGLGVIEMVLQVVDVIGDTVSSRERWKHVWA